jgi:hypothetical protein
MLSLNILVYQIQITLARAQKFRRTLSSLC